MNNKDTTEKHIFWISDMLMYAISQNLAYMSKWKLGML